MLPDLKTTTNFQQTFQVLVLFFKIKKLKTKKETFLKNWKIYFDHGVELCSCRMWSSKANGFIVELGAIEAASETGILQNFLFLLFLTPQIGKSVDDDTKNEIENDNDDREEEHVVNHSSSKHRLLEIPSTNEETVNRGY